MNTLTDLHDEFAALAAAAPDDDAVRAALAARLDHRARRRRTTALVAVAAAVVLVAGGVGLTRALVTRGPASPAGPAPVVAVPDVPLPADSQLIRHELQPVVSPVSAVPPRKLTGQTWSAGPGRLAVSWFSPDAGGASFGWTAYTPLAGGAEASAPQAAGYVVSDTRDDPIRTFGASGSTPATVQSRSITVAGHEAVLETAPPDSVDSMGFPAGQRISWELSDGRWIHVWATGGVARDSEPSPALLSFAGSITEKPNTLQRTIGIGVTLPGFTSDSSMNFNPITDLIGGSIWLCKPGVTPLQSTFGTTESGGGSGSAGVAPSDTSGDTPGDSHGGTTGTIQAPAGGQSASNQSEAQKNCIIAGVMNAGGSDLSNRGGTPITVAGEKVLVVANHGTATADLGDGLTAVVNAPTSAHLSDADLAALVASVRISPDVEVVPIDPGTYGQTAQGSATASGSASATASTARPGGPASSSAVPVGPTKVTPFVISPQRQYGNTADHGKRTITLTFSIQNVTDEPVRVTGLTVHAARLTQTSAQVRPDAGESGSGEADFAGSELPVTVAPRAAERVRMAFYLAGCSAVADDNPPLTIRYETATGGGELNLSLPYGNFNGWITEVTAPLCP